MLRFFQEHSMMNRRWWLYNHIKNLDRHRMPLSKEEFLKLAYQYAEKLKIKHLFNNTKTNPGKNFYYDFMKRHNDLRLRRAASTNTFGR